MSIDCAICFFEIQEKDTKIKCSNPDCVVKVCEDCIRLYIEYANKELIKTVPKCPSKGCNGEFLYSQIRFCKSQIIKLYEKLCLNYLLTDNIDDIILSDSKKNLLKKIRDERHSFIKKEYPFALNYIIENALKTKLNKITKKNREHVQNTLSKSNRKCPDVLCISGILDKNFICVSCAQKYCKKCEIKITGEGYIHECKQEDIDTINFVEQLVKCPTCKLPVIKSYGCDNMTCSNCKTNFDYESGEKTIDGNHVDETINLKRYDLKMSTVFEEEGKYDNKMMKLLQHIENKKPESESFEKIISLLKKYLVFKEKFERNEIADEHEYAKILHSIAKRYEVYKLSLHKKHKYFKYIEMINKYHEKDELTLEILEGICKDL